MNIQRALHGIATEHQLSPENTARLFQLADRAREPGQLRARVLAGMAVLAATMVGLGIVFWIAANWNSIGRAGQFALLQVVVVIMGLGALAVPRARTALSLLAFIATGGLFAYFGQTYQTGADPWQLFALWAALMLPLCVAVRHDALWAPWALVAMTGVSLWLHAYTGHRWLPQASDLTLQLVAWVGALVITFALSRPLEHITGAGIWALRLSVLLTVILVTGTALGTLSRGSVPPNFLIGLLLMIAASGAFATARLFDIFVLSVIALGLNAMVFGLLLVSLMDMDFLGLLLILGLAAAGMLAGTVQFILRVARHHAQAGAAV